jgi:hypothetical protein
MARTLRGTGRSSKAPRRKTKPKGRKMRPSMKGGVKSESVERAKGMY